MVTRFIKSRKFYIFEQDAYINLKAIPIKCLVMAIYVWAKLNKRVILLPEVTLDNEINTLFLPQCFFQFIILK